MERCYQVMETDDRALLDEWIANWNDLVEFEVHPVMTSADAADGLHRGCNHGVGQCEKQ